MARTLLRKRTTIGLSPDHGSIHAQVRALVLAKPSPRCTVRKCKRSVMAIFLIGLLSRRLCLSHDARVVHRPRIAFDLIVDPRVALRRSRRRLRSLGSHPTQIALSTPPLTSVPQGKVGKLSTQCNLKLISIPRV
ncbi:hypothetical protein BS17DRAFT_301906 [Gyrodon lividus]|nr:hypothetical protein BS17DRAFT_301906 [Gyrodon lividus]